MINVENIINKNLKRRKTIEKKLLNQYIENSLIDETINYLSSEEAFTSIEKDPYWPKWESPWWRISLLYEMNLLKLVPKKIISIMEKKIDSHYIKFFPLIEEDIPEGINPIKQIICHCQLGTTYKIYNELNNANKFQWARDWFIKYQLNDGGLNCDESVYTKENPKSSIVSTLPCLEAILDADNINEEEIKFLDKGANYLIQKKIFRKSDGSIINEHWLKPFFPRFYEFDTLRCLKFLTKWAISRNKELPLSAISETIEILDSRINEDNLMLSGDLYFLNYNPEYNDGLFPLLNKFDQSKNGNKYLSKDWYETITNLKVLEEKMLLT